MPFRGSVVATPKGILLATSSSGVGNVATPAGPLASLRYRSKVSVSLLAIIQRLYHWARTRPVIRTVASSVVNRSNPFALFATTLKPAGTVIGSSAFVLLTGLSVASAIKPIWVRGTKLAERIINLQNPIPVSLLSIGLVMPPTPMARADAAELWPLTPITLLPSTTPREEFPVPSDWVSIKPPKTPLHAWPSGFPVRPSKFTTNCNFAWTVVPASNTTKITTIFLINCFIIKPFQNWIFISIFTKYNFKKPDFYSVADALDLFYLQFFTGRLLNYNPY